MDLNVYDLENLEYIAHYTFSDDELGSEVTPEMIQDLINA